MTSTKINELVSKKNQLSLKEKQKLAKGILNNKEAREIAMIGALHQGNFDLAVSLMVK
jgi:hypothetical protein